MIDLVHSEFGAVTVYTDGCCNIQYETGAWATLIFINDSKKILQGICQSTTHQRMELVAVIESLKWLMIHYPDMNVKLITDSQYVERLPLRKTKLELLQFVTKQNEAIRNADLLIEFYKLISLFKIEIVKVKAHQKKSEEYNGNREVDLLCRKVLREALKE